MNKRRSPDGASMVGRSTDQPDTDRAFHEIGMALGDDAERASIEKLTASELVLIIEQLERWAALYPRLAADGYRSLLAKRQDHPDRTNWEKRVDDIELTIVGNKKR
jgi:hypothetical protein